MPTMDTDYHMEDPLLTERGTVGFITSNTFAGCSSPDDSNSRPSDGTDEYVSVLACFPVNRRKRKMLQPKRAPMYGSEVESVRCNSTDESHRCKPKPVKQHVEVVRTPMINSVPVPAAQKSVPAPAASKATRLTSSTVPECSKKSCSPICGPCGNCGTTTSPQWRHGNDKKPIVCNACGIRYQRTGSFEKTTQSEKKRAASGGSGAVSGGAQHAKRCKTGSQSTSSVDTSPANNSPEAVSSPAGRAPTDSRKLRRSSPIDTVLSNAASPCASPAIIPLAADTASTPASPLMVDDPCANNAAGNSAYAANHHTHADQQYVPTPKGRHNKPGSRPRPSPLGRVSMPAGAPANDAPAPGQPTSNPAVSALVPVGQVISGTSPFSAGSAAPLAVANIPSTAIAAGPTNGTAAGSDAAQAVIQPDLLQILNILATGMGSIDAAVAYMMASAGGMTAGNMVVPVAGLPGQALAHNWW